MNKLWRKTTLGNCLDILTDFTANGSFESLKQNVHYYNEPAYAVLVRTTDLGKRVFAPERFTDERGYKYLRKTALFGSEILIANVGSVGKVYRVPHYQMPMTLAPNMYLLKFKPSINNDFIFQFLISESFRIALQQNVGSTTLQAINKDNLRSIPLCLPDSNHQTQIAAILSCIDRAIEHTEALIAKQQRIKTGLMQDLLTKGIDEHGNIRSEATHEFKDSPLGRIPKEWEVDELRAYISYISYGFTNPMPEATDGPYMVTAANINEGRILYDTCRRTSTHAFNKLLTKKSRPKLSDLLITKDGTLGRLAIVDRVPLCINQSVAIMRVNERVSVKFLKILLESNYYQKKILDDAGGSTIKHIYITKIDKMPLMMPCSTIEQERILDVINRVSTVIECEQKRLSVLESMKRGLMQDLLTGKVSVESLLAESGAVFNERLER